MCDLRIYDDARELCPYAIARVLQACGYSHANMLARAGYTHSALRQWQKRGGIPPRAQRPVREALEAVVNERLAALRREGLIS